MFFSSQLFLFYSWTVNKLHIDSWMFERISHWVYLTVGTLWSLVLFHVMSILYSLYLWMYLSTVNKCHRIIYKLFFLLAVNRFMYVYLYIFKKKLKFNFESSVYIFWRRIEWFFWYSHHLQNIKMLDTACVGDDFSFFVNRYIGFIYIRI